MSGCWGKIPANQPFQISRRIPGGIAGDLAVVCAYVGNKDPDLQDVFSGNDGTRARDLRCDRPVLALPGWAGIRGNSGREQALRPPRGRELRLPAAASGDLVRDVCGMRRCRS